MGTGSALRNRTVAAFMAFVTLGAFGVSAVVSSQSASAAGLVPSLTVTPASAGLSKIKHVIILMQENHSFDSYFGMYPGADGIPVDAQGNPTVCVPDPQQGTCVYPYHDPSDVSNGGPHGASPADGDIDGGKMDGFIKQYENAVKCKGADASDCGFPKPYPDVMSYKLRSDIPEYWAYADNYVLQDHMFGSGRSWSLPEAMSLVSDWTARCYITDDPMSCENELDAPDDPRYEASENYAWTSIATLLDRNHTSWGYYVFDGSEPDCDDGSNSCIPLPQSAKTGSIWNPLPLFSDVKQDGTVGNVQTVDNFAAAARNGTLPAVSWVRPTASVSEHPPARLTDARAYMTYMINQVMQGPDWDSSAIFVTWDEWGGFYDHVNPPVIDANGLGIRVPGLVISPYAKQGYIDHSIHSFDSYERFIEDVFLGGSRLDPTTDGRPDTRPDVRENAPQLASLDQDFDFTQPPRPPLVIGNTSANAISPPIHPKAATIHAATIPKAPAAKSASASSTTTPVAGSIFPAGSAATTTAPKTAVAAAPKTTKVTGVAPYNAVLDASGTTDSSSTITRWQIRYGDGTSAKGTGKPGIFSHTYAAAGSYTASIKVVDAAKASAVAKVTIVVTPSTPSVWISGDQPLGFDTLDEHFNASESSPGNWTISFGDGTPDATGTGTPPANLDHHFTTVGIYTTTLTVTNPTTGLSNVARAISTVSASRAPTAQTKLPDVTTNGAKLGVDLWTNGQPTQYHFEWGTDPNNLTHITPTRSALKLGASSPTEPITGLTGGTTYYFRVVASNSVGTTIGETLHFMPGGGPKVFTINTSNLTSTSVTMTGLVNPNGTDTQIFWEFGTGGSLGESTTPQDVGAVPSKQLISTNVTGLQPGTKYSYRMVAENDVGQAVTKTGTFTTPAS